MQPMIMDFIWWKTCGEVEWEEYQEAIDAVVGREM